MAGLKKLWRTPFVGRCNRRLHLFNNRVFTYRLRRISLPGIYIKSRRFLYNPSASGEQILLYILYKARRQSGSRLQVVELSGGLTGLGRLDQLWNRGKVSLLSTGVAPLQGSALLELLTCWYCFTMWMPPQRTLDDFFRPDARHGYASIGQRMWL